MERAVVRLRMKWNRRQQQQPPQQQQHQNRRCGFGGARKHKVYLYNLKENWCTRWERKRKREKRKSKNKDEKEATSLRLCSLLKLVPQTCAVPSFTIFYIICFLLLSGCRAVFAFFFFSARVKSLLHSLTDCLSLSFCFKAFYSIKQTNS